MVNFAHGAMAMYVTYIFIGLYDQGEYFLPPIPNPLVVVEGLGKLLGATWELPDIPATVSLGAPLGFTSAFAVALVSAAVLGLGAHVMLFRPLRYAPALAKVVASVGLMIFLQGVVVLRFGTGARNVPPILPSSPVSLAGASVPVDRLALVGIVVLTGAALWALFRFSRFGLVVRAAAENEKAVTLLGYSADLRAGVTWVLAAVLAGAVGILVAPISSVTPANYTLFILPALGAALIGRFRSFGLTVIAGLAIGVLQSELQYVEVVADWVPKVGLRYGLPFLVVIGALIAYGKRLPTRGAIEIQRLPEAPMPRHVGVVVSTLASMTAIALIWAPFGWRSAIIGTLIGVVVSLSLVVITGFIGQISLAQMAFAGIGGFALSSLATGASVPFPLAPLLAAGAAAGFGAVLALPALRIRGLHLAIVTLAAGVAVEVFLFDNSGWFGGPEGVSIPAPGLFGIGFGQAAPFPWGDDKIPSPAFGLFVLVVTVMAVLGVARLRASRLGRSMLAVRSNERAAAAAGVNVTAMKLIAFTISAFIAGIAGTLIGYRFGTLSPASFGVFVSLAALAFAYLGGISTVGGAVFGGVVFAGGLGFYVIETVFDIKGYEFLLGGLLLMIAAVRSPSGIAGVVRELSRVLRRHPGRRAGSIVVTRHEDPLSVEEAP